MPGLPIFDLRLPIEVAPQQALPNLQSSI